MPEPTRGAVHFFHIQYFLKCISVTTYKYYLLLLNSTEFTAFGRVLANSANFVPENIGHLGFGKNGGPNGRRLWCPQKNEFSMLWSMSVPNFMLVDKSAQYPPKTSLRAWTTRENLSMQFSCLWKYC